MIDAQKPENLSVLQSVRTQFGLLTGAILLGLLLLFYLGGRFVVVHMVRNAEHEVRVIGEDIKQIVYGDLNKIRRRVSAAAEASKTAFIQHNFDLKQLLGERPRLNQNIHLAVLLDANGVFTDGYYVWNGMTPTKLSRSVFARYEHLFPIFVQQTSTSTPNQSSYAGLIRVMDETVCIAVAPLPVTPENPAPGYLILGSLFRKASLVEKINLQTDGMAVKVTNRAMRKRSVSTDPQTSGELKIAPIFAPIQNFYSGGTWHLGDNNFEAVLPIHDIMGNEISSITIRLPQTFSTVANVALGWLTVFIALIGIISILPIFWFETRLLLNPLTVIATKIKVIGENLHPDRCQQLDWPKNDEFGLLVSSVNRLLETIVRSNAKVAQSELRQRAMIACVPDALAVFDTKANLITLTKQPDNGQPIEGLTPGQPLSGQFFAESERDLFKQAVVNVFEKNGVEHLLLHPVTATREKRYLETRITQMDRFSVLVIMRDVTREWQERDHRIQAEGRLARVEKQESLSLLSASVAHDMNTALSTVTRVIDKTWANETSPKVLHALEVLRKVLDASAAMSHDLMIYAGEAAFHFVPVHLKSLIEEWSRDFAVLIPPNVSLVMEQGDDVPDVDLDAHQFKRVFKNLLNNAIEAIGAHYSAISLSIYAYNMTRNRIETFFCTHELTPGPGVIFQMKDAGIGMTPEMLTHIFEPFYSTKSIRRGLGLPTVLSIIDAHGGAISIQSEPGEGTVVSIWLPLTSMTDIDTDHLSEGVQQALRSANIEQAHDSEKAARTFLIIDDDPSILTSAKLLIKNFLKADVLTASTKREALSVFRKESHRVTAILLDAHLGKLDTVRLLPVLRMCNPNVPIVIISGSDESVVHDMFGTERYDAFLAKPYTMSDLQKLMDTLPSLQAK